MKNSEYWKNRFVEMEEATHQISVKKTMDIQEQFDKSQKIIEEKINAWYQRYADNNNMSLLEARKSLNDKELKELKWDVEEYIKKGRENAFSGEWVKELENASAKAHISRLEALELQCRQQAETAFGNLNDEVSKHIKDVYKDSYYRTAFEIQKGVGVGSNFATLNDKLIEKVVNKPWLDDGKNFSDRIWGNKTQLINQLHTSLSQMCITGSRPDKAISQIASKMNVSKANAGRLVMTESAYFSSTAQKECFKELDVERYEIVATLDGHTSDICQEMDGKVFKMSEYEEGVTAPPFHVNCRSCTAPYFDDEFANEGERIARDEEDDTYYVPEEIKYKDWKRIYVDNKLVKNIKYTGIPKTWVKQDIKIGTNKEDLAALNPSGSKVNCVNCAMAYEMQKRGYNVVAIKEYNKVALTNPASIWENWENIKIEKIPNNINAYEYIKKYMNNGNQEMRIQINALYGNSNGIFNRKRGDNGHTFIGEKTEKGFNIIDVQGKEIYNNSKDITEYLERYSKMEFFRIDNLVPNDRGSHIVMRSELYDV